MPQAKPDFTGYATAYGVRCTDGRIIQAGAFEHQQGMKVPLVWQHKRNDPGLILGHAILSHSDRRGMYTKCYFNNSEAANSAKELLKHGDVDSLSIYANRLKHTGTSVTHGKIQEVSIVLSGANAGAHIDWVDMEHDDDSPPTEAFIYNPLPVITDPAEFEHADTPQKKQPQSTEEDVEEEGGQGGQTVGDIIDSMNEEQKNVLYYLIAQAAEGSGGESEAEHSAFYDEGDDYMPRNVFSSDASDSSGPTTMPVGDFLSHDDFNEILTTAKRGNGSIKDAFEGVLSYALAHADEDYEIDGIDLLFPDAKNVGDYPEKLTKRLEWVQNVFAGVRNQPFSRIRTTIADLTADELRAKGHMRKGLKTEDAMKISRRVTTPTSFYVKRKIDRQDVVDITDFDILAFIKAEMRVMLDAELARAILIGDGRAPDNVDKIDEDCIRPVYRDDAMFVSHKELPATLDWKDLPDEVVRVKAKWKGTGKPTLYTTQETVTELQLLKDLNQRYIYETEAALAARLGVSSIVVVDEFEGISRVRDTDNKTLKLLGILVNLNDYSVGTDKGGETNFFDDFDIDVNQLKMLMEGRCSGALTKPNSAVVLEKLAA